MKLIGDFNRQHIKVLSGDLNKSTSTRNHLISKLLNQSNTNKLNTDSIETQTLGNFKSNVQNIFANDDKRKRAIQYVINIRKERNKSPSINQEEYLTLNKNRVINNNNSEIDIINNKNSHLNKRNSRKIEINYEKKEYNTLDYNFYNLYNETTYNNYEKINENKKK